jgi:hypothetical protein
VSIENSATQNVRRFRRLRKRSTAATPKVVIAAYQHRAIPDGRARSQLPRNKLPEWATLTTVITATSVFAFATSSFYVFAFGFAEQTPFAIYFSPADYLRIAPSWLIPADRWIVPIVLGMTPTLLLVQDKLPAIAQVALLSFYALLILFGCAARVSAGAVVKLLMVAIPWATLFALLLGYRYEPDAIKNRSLSRVLYETDKDHVTAKEGRQVFDLDRYLLISVEDKSGHYFLAIPHEKIKSIETPPLPIQQDGGGD